MEKPKLGCRIKCRNFLYIILTTGVCCFPTNAFLRAASNSPAAVEPALASPVQEQNSQDSGIQLLLSQNIEERIKEAVAPIIIGEKFTVSVKVWVRKEQERKEMPKAAQDSGAVVEEDEEILPGIPRLKGSLGEKKQLDKAVIRLISKTSIQKVGVRIFVDETLAQDLIESIKKIAGSAAGLDMGRGDEIVVEKIAFPKASAVKRLWVSDFLLNPRYLWIAVGSVLGLLFLVFLFGPAKNLAQAYIQAIQFAALAKPESKEVEAKSPESKGEKSPEQALQTAELEIEEALAAASEEISKTLSGPSASGAKSGNGHSPFSFVNEKSLPNFLYLIQREPNPAIAVAVHYLEPSIGAQLLSALPMDKRSIVVQLLSKVQEREPADVQGLEAKVHAKLHYVVGGEDKLRDLVSFAEPEIQPALISSIRSVDPALAEKVERTMVSIELLAGVEPAVLQAVIRQMGLRNFCPLMLSLTEPLREKIAAKLPGGQAQRVKEEIELSKPFPPAKFKEERNRLIGILRKLQQEGILAS